MEISILQKPICLGTIQTLLEKSQAQFVASFVHTSPTPHPTES
jgi:hypothetical protein